MKFVNKVVKNILDQSPEFKQKYVSYGLALSYLATKPIKGLLLHLMYIQNIDPSIPPGQKFRKEIVNAFDKLEDKDFDSDFNLSWVGKSYKSVKDNFGKNVNELKFKKLTDISNLSSPVASKPVSGYKNKYIESSLSSEDSDSGGPLSTNSLKAKLDILNKYAADLESPDTLGSIVKNYYDPSVENKEELRINKVYHAKEALQDIKGVTAKNHEFLDRAFSPAGDPETFLEEVLSDPDSSFGEIMDAAKHKDEDLEVQTRILTRYKKVVDDIHNGNTPESKVEDVRSPFKAARTTPVKDDELPKKSNFGRSFKRSPK